MMVRRFAWLALAGLCAVGTPALAADTVRLTLASPVQRISPGGGTVSFYGTISAPTTNSGTISLNAISINVTSQTFGIDGSGFLDDFPFEIDAGGSASGLLFTLFVPQGTSSRPYTGVAAILGGPSFESQDVIGQATFEVDVAAAAAAVPEPATWATMLLGMGAVGYALRRRRASVAFAA